VNLALVASGWTADVPVELGRDEARELAIRELANPAYDADPPLPQRVVEWIIQRIQELIGRAAGALDEGFGIAILAAVLALVIAAVVLRMGPLARRRRVRSEPLFPTGRRTAAEYRAAADAAAAEENWSAAVIERYRAIVVGFEERGLLEPRPGRTADEAAAEAGVIFPGLVAELTDASRLFDAVRYGGHAATHVDDARMRRLDDEARAARPASNAPTTGVLSLAAPR
jgi:Domain of unknown function (DUF4129)